MAYTKQQLENMSIEELRRIDRQTYRQTPIRPGDSVRDINPSWPNYMETGTVLSVRGDMVTWRCNRSGDVHTDRMSELQRI